MLAVVAGIGGAVFFSPIFLLGLKLKFSVAIETALIAELVGFSSVSAGGIHARLIDCQLAKRQLASANPAAVAGVILAPDFPAVALKTIFAVGIIFIGLQLFTSCRQQ
jgi:uncharacterized membrane protein YfcA